MKPEIEFENIRREQEHIHGLVDRLDEHIAAVARALQPLQPAPLAAPATDVPATAPIAPAAPMPAMPSLSTTSPAPSPDRVPIQPPVLQVRAEEKPTAPMEPQERTQRDRPESAESLEIQFGRVWLVRIGIVILLTGLIFLGNLAYQHIIPRLGPGGKLTLIGLAGGALLATGLRLERRGESLRNYARVLFAGGCATFYYTAYAAHFVTALRVIESPLAGGLLLLVLGAGIVWEAHRRRSESLAVLAILLSYYASGVNPLGAFTLYSSLLLTASAVFLLVRHRWARLSFMSLAGTYASYAWWRFFHGGQATDSLAVQLLFLGGYWAIFTVGALFAARRVLAQPVRITFLTANNAAFFLLGSYEFAMLAPGQFWIFSLVCGGVLLGLSVVEGRRAAPDAPLESALFAPGLALFTLGLASHLTGFQLALALAAQSIVLLGGGKRRPELQQIASLLSIAGAALVALEGLRTALPHAPLTGALVALVLAFHGWWTRPRAGHPEEAIPLSFAFVFAGEALAVFSLWSAQGTLASVPWLALGVVLLAALAIALRFRELATASFWILPAAVGLWLTSSDSAPLAPISLLLAGLALALGWPRQRALHPSPLDRVLLESTSAFAAALAGMFWLRLLYPPSVLMALSAGAGVLWIGLSVLARAPFLAAAGLVFSALSLHQFTFSGSEAPWALALCPALGFLALALLTRWLGRLGGPVEALAGELRTAATGLALALLLPWSFQHIPNDWLVLFFAALGSGCALASIRHEKLAWFALGLGGLAAIQFALRFGAEPLPQNLAAILLFPMCCRIARHFGPAGRSLLPEAAPVTAWATVALLTLWLGRANGHYHWGLGSTVLWALLAPAFFGAGFALRERPYRHAGLLLLGLGVGHLFLHDVWSFDPLSRILSFLVLGLMLLVMGYFYNRFEEKLRRWL